MSDDFPVIPWPERPDPNAPCPYAAELARRCDEAIARLDSVKAGSLTEAFVLLKAELFDTYCDYLTDTPKNHSNAAGKRKHRCIDDVFKDAAREIRRRWRAVPLPMKLVSGPSSKAKPKPPTQEIRGFPLGKVEPDPRG